MPTLSAVRMPMPLGVTSLSLTHTHTQLTTQLRTAVLDDPRVRAAVAAEVAARGVAESVVVARAQAILLRMETGHDESVSSPRYMAYLLRKVSDTSHLLLHSLLLHLTLVSAPHHIAHRYR